MPFNISCPSCRALHEVADKRIGESARCRKCGATFALSLPTNPDAGAESAEMPDLSKDDVGGVSAQEELRGKFGRYEIVRVLGKGGMGAVYLATDTLVRNRLVALKVPLRKFAFDAYVRERFKREAQIGQEFRHNRFCAVYDMGEIDGRLYLSMEYIEGETLADRLKRTGPFSEKDAVEITRKIALALADAHARDILHRDLKPSNVMIDAKGDVHIMDFGLAKRFDAEDPSLTNPRGSLGTPEFMSPEQVKGDKTLIGPRSDVYSLGVILYQLLTGRLPYQGVNVAVIHAQILSTMVPKPPSVHRPGLSPSLEAVCLKAMAKKSRDRYGSMTEFAEALLLRAPVVPPVSEPIRVEVLVHPPPGGSAELVREPKGKGENGWIGLTAIAAVAMLAAAALFGQWLNRPEPSGEGDGPPVGQVGAAPKIETPKAEPEQKTESVVSKSESPKPAASTEVAKTKPVSKAENTVSKAPDTSKPESPKPAPPVTKASHKPLDVVENSIGMKLVLIPNGTFEMGSEGRDKDEQPKHQVTISRPFWLGAQEVTQDEYQALMGSNPSWFASTGEGKAKVAGLDTRKFPVESVSWFDAVAFCNALSTKERLKPFYTISGTTVTVADWTGPGYRLPTEAEWEYACRAGSSATYSFGDDAGKLNEYAWYGGNSDGRTHAVGTRSADKFGLYDMHGNVWEWCWDWYDSEYYAKSRNAIDPRGPTQAVDRVYRGGGWGVTAGNARSASRRWITPEARSDGLGVRVAQVQSGP